MACVANCYVNCPYLLETVLRTNPVVPLASWMVNPLTSADIITTSDEELPGFCNVIGTTSLNLKDF